MVNAAPTVTNKDGGREREAFARKEPARGPTGLGGSFRTFQVPTDRFSSCFWQALARLRQHATARDFKPTGVWTRHFIGYLVIGALPCSPRFGEPHAGDLSIFHVTMPTLDNPLLQPALTPDEAVRLAWAVVQIVPVRGIPWRHDHMWGSGWLPIRRVLARLPSTENDRGYCRRVLRPVMRPQTSTDVNRGTTPNQSNQPQPCYVSIVFGCLFWTQTSEAPS
ncbi:hypothetical protein B0I37DRAFT_106844 [Chaetomium sp. MPI-CAGE-AT-0009]|nr:hypothetical protein B0I37DRAFT_106844 [Chaetomium sp. MPI-CAGE-AT-0009]